MNRLLFVTIGLLLCGCERQAEYPITASQLREVVEARAAWDEYCRKQEELEHCAALEQQHCRSKQESLRKGEIIWTTKPSWATDGNTGLGSSCGPFWVVCETGGEVEAVCGAGRAYRIHAPLIDWKRRLEELKEKCRE